MYKEEVKYYYDSGFNIHYIKLLNFLKLKHFEIKLKLKVFRLL